MSRRQVTAAEYDALKADLQSIQDEFSENPISVNTISAERLKILNDKFRNVIRSMEELGWNPLGTYSVNMTLDYPADMLFFMAYFFHRHMVDNIPRPAQGGRRRKTRARKNRRRFTSRR